MKKVFLALAAIVTIAAFTSCNKTCDCTLYAGDEGTVYEDLALKDIQASFSTYVKEEVKKCSDVNNFVTDETLGTGKWGVECK